MRKAIYKHAELIEIPPQTIIFNKGDLPDYMYIIIKGRISVESHTSQYSDVPVILATLKDGEAFGELAVVDQEKISEKQADPFKDNS